MDRGPIPGWAPADERSLTGDAARRPVGAVVGEAFGLYRRHARPLLLMTAVLEVPATLLALPYLILTWSLLAESLASLPSIGDLAAPDGQGGSSVIFWTSTFSDRFRVLADPLVGALGGAGAILPYVAMIILAALFGAFLLAPDAPAPSPRAAAGRTFRAWLPLLIVSVVVVGAWALLGLVSALVNARTLDAQLAGGARLSSASSSLGIGFAALLILCAGAYVIARCVFVPQALTLEAHGLGSAVRRSARLTRRRVLHVVLILILGGLIIGFTGGLMLLVVGVLGGVLVVLGGDGLLPAVGFVGAVGYLSVQVLLGPIVPLLTTILYRDARDAGER